jgi:hypothetical protein
MKKIWLVFIIILAALSNVVAQTQSIVITNQADSISIYDNLGGLVAKLIWPNNPIVGSNDTLDVSINPASLQPPTNGGKNYNLSQTLHFSLRHQTILNFRDGLLRLRLYVDTTEFKLTDVISHTWVYKIFDNDSIYERVNFFEPYHSADYAEVELWNISNNQNFLASACNLLFGEFYSNQLTEPFTEEVLIPRNKVLILNSGISLMTPNYSKFIINGRIICNGTQLQPIDFNQISLVVNGNDDEEFNNNLIQINFNYTTISYLNQYNSNSYFDNCILRAIWISDYSISNFINSKLFGASIGYSKVKFNVCEFDSNGYVNTGHSIVEITNSLMKHITNEYRLASSFIHLGNNVIYADAFGSAINLENCLGVIENNKFYYTDSDHYNDAIDLLGGSFAILSRNIIKGFRVAAQLSSGEKLVLYNNTIEENVSGVAVATTPNTMSIFNNIFYKQLGWGINLDFNSYYQGHNNTYVDNNLCFTGDPFSIRYINNPQDSSFVYGNNFYINADPSFSDPDSCTLNFDSPAIDKGLKKIYSIGYQYSVLDTTIIVPDSISILDYYGLYPDLGAKEYSPSSTIENNAFLQSEFTLNQNYPNPFNPSTNIQYAISSTQFVTLKVYDILGREVAILVNEEKPAGTYNVEFRMQNLELSSGIYFYKLQAGDFVETKKMILLK